MSLFDDDRSKMVELLIKKGIKNPNILKVMSEVERHLFVPSYSRSRAYEDCALPIGFEQTISQPYTVAVMTELLIPLKDDKILEIGTGSGYQSVILSKLGCRVFTIERNSDLARSSEEMFKKLNLRIASRVGDGTLGWKEYAPFNGIIVTAGAPVVPEKLQNQLIDGGRLVIPVGDKKTQTLIVIDREGDKFTQKNIDGFKFVPLIGKEGWKESE
ncbi:MAG: protein-L-isoaspartate(D-aspartate) O-methyltransferase [Bacteroidetes bacterium]|nr:protein-L-isoaspartate(D-aspartate) O-methyltransferase [Bacteroidota bacterium]